MLSQNAQYSFYQVKSYWSESTLFIYIDDLQPKTIIETLIPLEHKGSNTEAKAKNELKSIRQKKYTHTQTHRGTTHIDVHFFWPKSRVKNQPSSVPSEAFCLETEAISTSLTFHISGEQRPVKASTDQPMTQKICFLFQDLHLW